MTETTTIRGALVMPYPSVLGPADEPLPIEWPEGHPYAVVATAFHGGAVLGTMAAEDEAWEIYDQGPWTKLETAVRELVQTAETVSVITGPLYEQNRPGLPNADETHTVPSGYWKIVAIGDPGNQDSVSAVAFIMDQDTPRNADFTDHIESIEEVQQRSGLDFFWELPGNAQTQLESAAGSWPPQ